MSLKEGLIMAVLLPFMVMAAVAGTIGAACVAVFLLAGEAL